VLVVVPQRSPASFEDLEKKLRELGGDDLRKIEIKTKVAISKFQRGFKEIADKLSDK